MSKAPPSAEYIADADILYVRLRDGAVARTRTLDHWRNLDLDAHGALVAVEFINAVSAGIDLEGVPERELIIQAAGRLFAAHPDLERALTDRACIDQTRAALTHQVAHRP